MESTIRGLEEALLSMRRQLAKLAVSRLRRVGRQVSNDQISDIIGEVAVKVLADFDETRSAHLDGRRSIETREGKPHVAIEEYTCQAPLFKLAAYYLGFPRGQAGKRPAGVLGDAGLQSQRFESLDDGEIADANPDPYEERLPTKLEVLRSTVDTIISDPGGISGAELTSLEVLVLRGYLNNEESPWAKLSLSRTRCYGLRSSAVRKMSKFIAHGGHLTAASELSSARSRKS